MNVLIKIIVIGFLSLYTFQNETTHTITVTVENTKNNKGKMYIGLYNTEDSFLETPFKGVISKIVNNTCTVTFKAVPSGDYAVSVYHDKNDNGKLDTNFLGVPKEQYGCSNNAKGFMSAPKWEDAKFKLQANHTITISL